MALMLFHDRDDAGRQLARALEHYKAQDVIVLGIPRGGVAVAYHVARALQAPLDALVVRKMPVPWNPEAGFGAVGPDGSVILNEEIMPYLQLSPRTVDTIANQVYTEVRRRMREYREDRPSPSLRGKVVILVDDGLATGITTLAAIKTVRNQVPAKVVLAVPVASRSGIKLVQPYADEIVCPYVHPEEYPFAVAGFYRHWTDMTDEEVIEYLARPIPGPPDDEQALAS